MMEKTWKKSGKNLKTRKKEDFNYLLITVALSSTLIPKYISSVCHLVQKEVIEKV
jgi:hypothetical protein